MNRQDWFWEWVLLICAVVNLIILVFIAHLHSQLMREIADTRPINCHHGCATARMLYRERMNQ